jgi:hypothetical protein
VSDNIVDDGRIHDDDWANCLFVDGLAMKECTGKHRISFKVLGDEDDGPDVCLGVAPDGIGWNNDPFTGHSERGNGLCLGFGSLYGNGEFDSSRAEAAVLGGQIVTHSSFGMMASPSGLVSQMGW